MRRTVLVISWCAVLFLGGCRFITSLSEPTARQATSIKNDYNECNLSLSSGPTCKMSTTSCSQAIELMKELKNRPSRTQTDLLADEFVQKISRSSEKITEKCNIDLERWVIASFAGGKRAPYDVAGLVIPGLQEVKLLIWGGGMVAGFLGDGIGSACMSAMGAGISYAESKNWIKCR